MNIISWSDNDAEQLYYHFYDLHSERNVLLLGNLFDPEAEGALLKLRWNTVISIIRDPQKNNLILSILETESRKVVKLDHQKANIKMKSLHSGNSLTDAFELNFIVLVPEESENTLRDRTNAKKTLRDFLCGYLSKYGILYCVGYEGSEILPPDSLLECFMELEEKRQNKYIYLFGIRKEMKELTQNAGSNLILVSQKLTELWNNKLKKYSSDDDEYYERPSREDDLMIFIDKKTKFIPRSELKDINSFASLLDFKTMTPEPKPRAQSQLWFASFLKNDSSSTRWYGYRERYYLERDFQTKLLDTVHTSMDHRSNVNHRPILLHGQSGSGKTIAVGLLAYQIFHERQIPVVMIRAGDINFFNDDTVTRSFESLKNFLQYLQSTCEASSILLIWDCSGLDKERSNYNRLYRTLKNHGLNIILVGTSYQYSKQLNADESNHHREDKSFYYIEATITITEKDITALDDLLKEKALLKDEDRIYITDRLRNDFRNNAPYKDHFLSMLYNVFWNIRSDLEYGICQEFQRSLSDLRTLVQNDPLQYSFFAKFSIKRYEDMKEKILELFEEKSDDDSIKDFMQLVAFFSYYNKDVSLDLACSVLTVSSDNIRKVLEAPIFNVREYSGSAFYSIRTQFEARLLLKSLFGNEVSTNYRWVTEYLCKLLYRIETDQFSSGSVGEMIEKVTRIISSIGPNSHDGKDFKWEPRYFIQYATCLIIALSYAADHLQDPRLMNQELTFRREYCIRLQKDDRLKAYVMDFETMKELFSTFTSEADLNALTPELLEIDLIETIRRGTEFLQENENIEQEFRSSFEQIRIEIANSQIEVGTEDALQKAIRICDYIIREKMSAYAITAWLRANNAIIELHDRIQPEYFERGMAIASHAIHYNPELLNDSFFMTEYLQTLKRSAESFRDRDPENLMRKMILKQPTPAFLFCWVYSMLWDYGIISETQTQTVIWRAVPNGSDAAEKTEELLTVLQKYASVIQEDANCMYLYLQLYWLLHNGKPLDFRTEKQHTFMTEAEWKETDRIACNVIAAAQVRHDTFLVSQCKYIQALARIQTGDYQGGKSILHESEIRKKLTYEKNITKHIICDGNGNPKIFSGIIVTLSDEIRSSPKMDLYVGQRKVLHGVYFNRFNIIAKSARIVEEGQHFNDCLMLGVGYMGISALRLEGGE